MSFNNRIGLLSDNSCAAQLSYVYLGFHKTKLSVKDNDRYNKQDK